MIALTLIANILNMLQRPSAEILVKSLSDMLNRLQPRLLMTEGDGTELQLQRYSHKLQAIDLQNRLGPGSYGTGNEFHNNSNPEY